MRKMVIGGLLAATLTVSSADGMVQGFCMQPHAPTTYLSKPQRPYCASSRSCEEWQVSSYRTEVESYLQRLRRYAAEVDEYYNDATAYVQCMSRLD